MIMLPERNIMIIGLSHIRIGLGSCCSLHIAAIATATAMAKATCIVFAVIATVARRCETRLLRMSGVVCECSRRCMIVSQCLTRGRV